MARTELGYTISEWLTLPWWQRRLYLEELVSVNEEQAAAARGDSGGDAGGGSASDPAAAILGGSMSDVAGLGFGTGS